MKKVVSILLAVVMLLSMSVTAFAAEADNVQSSYELSATMDDVLALEPYVVRSQDGTLSLNADAARTDGKNVDAIKALSQHFSVLNTQIQRGEISVDEDLNVINGEHIISSHRCSKGVNSYTTYWWGYQRYACNCETKRIVSDLNTWAAGGTMTGGAAAGVAIVFPVTAAVAGVIAAGAAFDAGYWWLLATRIDANNEGYGTIINMTHVLVFDIEPQ